jgi:hypothetical protein
MSQPWIKFFPSDWMADSKVKLCSREARSFWMDILCLLWKSENGRLEVNGQPASEKQIAAMTGDNPRSVKKMLSELLENEVCSLEDGFIINRRIKRDRIKAENDANNGRMGGNPALKNRDLQNKGVKAQKPEARSQKPDNIQDDKSSLSDLEIDEAIDCWRLASDKTGWPVPARLSASRRKKLTLRIEENGIEGWKEALRRAMRSQQLGHDPPSWFSFDWITANDKNILKVLEGNYDKQFRNGGNRNALQSEKSGTTGAAAMRIRDRLAAQESGQDELPRIAGSDGQQLALPAS